MRTTSLCRLGILLLVTWGFGVGVSQASAGRYGAIVIRNPTSITQHFQMRLGDQGPWSDFHVPPNTDHSVHFDLDSNGRAYAPNICFDCVAGDDCVTVQYYELDFYEISGPYPGDGKPYRFEYNDAGNRLDLYEVD